MEPLGQLHDADRPVGAGDHEPTGAELNISRGHLQHMRGDLPASLDHLFAGAHNRVAADDHRLRASGTPACDQFIAVALNEADVLERDAKSGR